MSDIQNPTISIIVPVYNVEQYLHRCLDSILAQTFTDFEVLVIDDGSPDRCGEICDEYAKKDSRIRVFHKENGGVSSARNLALDNAKGRWIGFVDPDDCVSSEYLNLMGYEDADVIQRSYHAIYCNGKIKKNMVRYKILTDQEEIFKSFVQKRSGCVWDKIYSADLLKGHYFDEQVDIEEDFLFNLSLIGNVKKFVFCSNVAYYWYENKASAMSTINKDIKGLIKVRFSVINHIQEICNNSKLEELGYNIINVSYVGGMWAFRKQLDNAQKKDFTSLIINMPIAQLKYASLKQKLKLIIKKISILVFKCMI